MFLTFGNIFILDTKKLLYECEIFMKYSCERSANFVLKGFGVVHEKFIVGKWCGILVIHKQ